VTGNAGPNVSRETLDKLKAYASLIEKWNPKINLVSRKSLPEIWERHISDSQQLTDLAPEKGDWADLGSGGGLPGIVVAIMRPLEKTILIESDQRKSAFLRTAVRELELGATVISKRIESTDPLGASVVSARALADLPTLLGYAAHHLRSDGVALLLKGKSWRDEDSAARALWSYDCEAITSKTNPEAAVLRIKDISRV
jgi:16S rRNA (guanine527-N7)-methyltransferase